VTLGKDGKPSQANHGNIPPTLDPGKGGVTLVRATQTTVLSLAALRRLHFPLSGSRPDAKVDDAARTVLAALALCAAALSRNEGFDLRSRCLLTPTGPVVWEWLDADGGAHPVGLPVDAAIALLADAVKAAAKLGLPWHTEPFVLQPSPQLVELVRKNRSLMAQKTAEA